MFYVQRTKLHKTFFLRQVNLLLLLFFNFLEVIGNLVNSTRTKIARYATENKKYLTVNVSG